MKKPILLALILLLLGSGVVFGQESEPIADARAHARIDSSGYTATGWGFLAFGASALISPLLGGGTVIVIANVVEPDVDIPPDRLAWAQDSYESSNDLLLYQSQYQQSMERPIQKARSRRAWIGTGIGFGVNLLILSILLSGY